MTQDKKAGRWASLAAVFAIMLLILPAAPSGSAYAATPVWSQIAGTTRYDTMAEIASTAFPKGASSGTAILVTGTNYPDALAATALAGLDDAPVIITESGRLSQQAADEMARLGISKIVIVGGASAVSHDVEAAAAQLGGVSEVTRIAGDNRQGTALAVYTAGRGSWGSTAIVSTGSGYADALSASPLAYTLHAPVFLACDNGALPADEARALCSGGFERVIIVGGSAVVPDATEAAIKASLPWASVVRLAGDNRYETSACIASYALDNGLLGCEGVAVATGANFPDGLAGGAMCGQTRSVLLLADNGHAADACAVLGAHAGQVAHGYFLGGDDAVTRYVQTKVENLWDASIPIEPPVAHPKPDEYASYVAEALQAYKDSGNNYARGMQDAYSTYGNYLNVSRYKNYGDGTWKLDTQGIPMTNYAGEWVYHPVSVDQYVLYCHGRYLDDPTAENKAQLITAADFLVSRQGADGAFRYTFAWYYYIPEHPVFEIGWVNSMAQGQAISALVRVYHVTGEKKYLDAAEKAYEFMLISQDKGGCRSSLKYLGYDEGSAYVTFEYQPIQPNAYTFNSFMYTMLGIYDLSQVPESAYAADASTLFGECLTSLKIMLPYYDLGGFAAYDLNYITYGATPNLNPHYMANDIFVLNALYNITGDETVKAYRDKFESYVPQ